MSEHEREHKRWVESGEEPGVTALLRALPDPQPPPGAETKAWARLEGRRDPRPVRWGVLAGACAAGMICVLALLQWTSGEPKPTGALAALTLVQGSVWGEGGNPLALGASLASGANITTGEGARALMRFETAKALLGPGTRLSIRSTPAGAIHLGLETGEVLVSSSKRAPGAALTVTASGHVVTVVGTVFRVRASPFAVQVIEGTVVVRGPEGEHPVHRGSSYGVDATPLESTAEELGWVQRLPTAQVAEPPAAATDLPPAPPPVRADQAPVPVPTVRAVPPSAVPSKAVEPLAEQQLRQTANLGTPRAAIALYQLGLLRLRKTHDLRGAANAFEEYRRRFGDGPLLEDAWLSLIETHLALNGYTDALTEANSFLKRFASSDRKNQVRLLRANIERETGDCATALLEYDALVREGGSEADDAAFFAAVCAGRDGHPSDAQKRLVAYLAAFPAGRHRNEARQATESRP